MIHRIFIALSLLAIAVVDRRRLCTGEARLWQAGVAKTVITPKQFMWMSGYGARTSPRKARSTISGPRRSSCKMPKANAACSSRWTSSASIANSPTKCATTLSKNATASNAARSCCRVSHTHCGPVVGRNLIAMYSFDDKQQQLVKAYTADLHAKLVELVGAAVEDDEAGAGDVGTTA